MARTITTNGVTIEELTIIKQGGQKKIVHDAKLIIDKRKKTIYFGANWKVLYKNLDDGCHLLDQIDSLLDDCTSILQGDEYEHEHETNIQNVLDSISLTLKTKKRDKFVCDFNVYHHRIMNTKYDNNNDIYCSSSIKPIALSEFSTFLQHFQGLCEKWSGSTKSGKRNDPHYQKSSRVNGIKSIKTNLKQQQRNFSRQSDHFSTQYDEEDDDLDHRHVQTGSFTAKDDHDEEDVCSLDDENNDQLVESSFKEKNDEEAKNPSKKRKRRNEKVGITKKGRRLAKMSSSVSDDDTDDEDIIFESSIEEGDDKLKNIDSTGFLEEENHGIALSKNLNMEDDEGMKVRNKSVKRNPKTDMTSLALDCNRKPVVVSPTNIKMKNKNEEVLSDAVTDSTDNEEDYVKENGSESTNPSITNFFKPKVGIEKDKDKPPQTLTKNKINNTDSTKSPSRKSKYFSQGTSKAYDSPNHSSVDRALSLPSRKSPPKLKTMNNIKNSPSHLKTVNDTTTNRKRITPLQITPVKNPYKKPPDEQSPHVGFKNLGNTCYINSSLQMIYSVPFFISSLQNIYDNYRKEGKEDSLPLTQAFLKVAWDAKIINCDKSDNMGSSLVRAANPHEVKQAIDTLTDKFSGHKQRDAHEFASALIDYMHEELKSNAFDDKTIVLPTDEFFRLDVKVCLTCDSCKYSRSKEEFYRHLSIELGKNESESKTWSVEQSLQRFFAEEVREIRCEKCETGTTATQTMEVLSKPKALLLHLKRFVVDERTVTFKKNMDQVSFAKVLSLDNVVNKSTAATNYHLKSIVCHIGEKANSGHYTAKCERINRTNNKQVDWVTFDDGVSKIASEKVQESEANRKSAYMLLYSA